MMKKFLVAALTVLLVSSTLAVNAAPKPTAYSPKAGEGRCQLEAKTKGYEAKLQTYLIRNSRAQCPGPNRVALSLMSKAQPKTTLTNNLGLKDASVCKLPQPAGTTEFRGFPVVDTNRFFNKRHPGPGSVIQVVGLSSPDAPQGAALPAEEYKFQLDRLADWLNNVNNSGQPTTIRVKDKWFDYGENLAPLKLSHKNYTEKTKQFSARVVQLVDPEIDFSDVDYLLVVVPAKTKYDVISQTGMESQLTNEGRIYNMSLTMQPNLDTKQTHEFNNFLTTTMTIHELYHPGFNMGDNYGDQKWQFENRGMGAWGMFSTGTTDMLQWQKWLVGFTTDAQVVCAPTDSVTTSWLAPGSTKTDKQKLLVVPLSTTEAIVVESVRATGLNYKLSQVEQGALVYTIDMTNTNHGFGYEVQFPDKRQWKTVRYAMDTAPLKKGEYFTYKGVKITNVEWGEFGDVIKVEPVAK
jgi:M6 family metalloprotease-like protein